MKGWLDKYGKEINANEGHSSAQDNWEGEGYSNVGRDYSPAWGGQFQKGGKLTAEQLDSLNKAKMKAKMALASEFGNPAARRMTSAYPSTYRFTGNEMINGESVGVPAGEVGTHYMGSMGEYAVPYIQQNASGNLQFNPNASPDDREAMKFDNPQDAEYFAEHYKEVAPMMRNFAMGGNIPGSVGFTYARTGGIPSNGPYAKKTKASAQNGETLDPTIPIEEGRNELIDFYKNRPSNLNGEEIANAVKDVKIKEANKRVLKRNKFKAYYDIGKNELNYDPKLQGSEDLDLKEIAKHEFGHGAYQKLSDKEKDIINSSIVSSDEFLNRTPEVNKDVIDYQKQNNYYTDPTEVYTRRNLLFKLFGLDPSKPITDDQADEMINFRKYMDPHLTDEQSREMSNKNPKLWDTYKKWKDNPESGNIMNFMNSMKEDRDTYKHMFNDVTVIPGEQTPTAKNGMTFYQHGLDWKPKSMKEGGWLDKYEPIKDDRGQWAHPGKITEIGSNQITMQGVPYPVLGISDKGDTKMMFPGEEYKFKGKKVTEFPMAQNGKTLPVIRTNDPKKVEKYNDSLAVYNSFIKNKKLLDSILTPQGIKSRTYSVDKGHPNGWFGTYEDVHEKETHPQYGPLIFNNNNGTVERKLIGNLTYPKYTAIDHFNIMPSRFRVYNEDPNYLTNKKDYKGKIKVTSNTLDNFYDESDINKRKQLLQKYPYTIVPNEQNQTLSLKEFDKPVQPYILNRVTDVDPINTEYSINPPGITQAPHFDMQLPPIQMGNYMVGYTDDSGQGVDRGFVTPEQRDAFVKELENRNLSSVQPYRGNITEYQKLPKKKNGGWLDKYK